MEDFSDDVVEDEYDVFVTGRAEDAPLMLVQYPLVASGAKAPAATEALYLERVGELRLRIPLDRSARSFNHQPPSNVDVDHIDLESSAVPAAVPQMAMTLKDGKVYLTPVSKTLQMRPDVSHVENKGDEVDNSKASSVSAVRTKYKRRESDRARTARKQSREYLANLRAADEPQRLQVMPPDAYESQVARNALTSQPPRTHQPGAVRSSAAYMASLAATQSEPGGTFSDGPVAAPVELASRSVLELRGAPLPMQVRELLRRSGVMSTEELLAAVRPRPEEDDLLAALARLGTLVCGCWVLSSDQLAFDDLVPPALPTVGAREAELEVAVRSVRSVVEAGGEAAEAAPSGAAASAAQSRAAHALERRRLVKKDQEQKLRRARDLCLRSLDAGSPVVRAEVEAATGVPADVLGRMLKGFARHTEEGGWTLALPHDNTFATRHPAVAAAAGRRWEQLCKQHRF